MTARAVGSVPVVLELAAPLTRVGGAAVLWRTLGEASSDAEGGNAAQILGFLHRARIAVTPFSGAERCLDVWQKEHLCPDKYPRRPGMAAKRPLA